MTKINVKGPIVSNDSAWLYRWLGWDACCVNDINTGLERANGDDVVIEVNSQGGLCTAGFEMYSAIKQYEGNVEVHVINACSAATFILCAADKVLMSDAAVVMIHNTQSSWGGGDYRDAQMTADMLREFNESVLNVYEKKTGKSREELQAMMDNDTYMSPQTAIKNGFADGMLFEEEKDDESSQMNFIEASKQMAVYNSTLPVISDEKAHELMLLLNSGKLPERKVPDDLNSNKVDNPSENADTNKNNITNENNGKEQNMTLEEMLKEHPELKAEVDGLKAEAKAEGEKEGADKERGRLENLDKIAANVSAEMLKNAKYGDDDARVDARELAYQAMLAQKQDAAAYMHDTITDSKESGVENVGADLSDSDKDKDVQDVENMAAYVNSRRGGKR